MIRDLLQHMTQMPHEPSRLERKARLFPHFSHQLRLTLTFLCAIVFLLSLSPSVEAMEPVSGHYRSTFGTTIELELQVGYPAPASLIVEQYFPAGLQILSAQPALQKYSSTQGMAKWFLKEIKPGSYNIFLQFDQPVQSSSVRGVIRYRYPLRGYFVEYRIIP